MEIKGIRYTAPIFDNSGYGKAARGNILALHAAGIPLNLNPISFESARPDLGEDGKILRGLINNNIEYNVNFIHTTPEFWEKYKIEACVNCGYTVWETTKLHPDWPKYINNNVTKVLVGCEWNKEVFKDSGVNIPIGVVPHGINMKDFENIDPYQIAGVKDDDFVLYSIFQFQDRKNPIGLLKAYFHAFTGIDDVALILKTYRNDYSDGEKEVIRTTIKNLKKLMPMDHYPRVVFLPNMLTEDEIIGLHKRGDCYVSLDRGEGFGLSGATAGACGNPIVITDFGGALEYAKEDNSYLTKFQLCPVSGMWWCPWYKGDQCWAEPDIIDGGNKMMYVYKNREEAKKKGLKLQKYISENFSWKVIADKMIKEIEGIDV